MARAIHKVEAVNKKPICGVVTGKHFSSVWSGVTCRSCLRKRALASATEASRRSSAY